MDINNIVDLEDTMHEAIVTMKDAVKTLDEVVAQRDRLDLAIREALDALTGWSSTNRTDAEKVHLAITTLNKALYSNVE